MTDAAQLALRRTAKTAAQPRLATDEHVASLLRWALAAEAVIRLPDPSMTRVEVTTDESAYIAARVQSFASEAEANWQWQANFVEQFEALPLFLGWTETLGVRPDGSLVRWSTEGEYVGVRPVDRRVDVNLALIHGSRRHPMLVRLIPQPPSDAIVCAQCHGTGRVAVSDDPLICACGGAGWVVAGEQFVHAEQIRGDPCVERSSSSERDY